MKTKTWIARHAHLTWHVSKCKVHILHQHQNKQNCVKRCVRVIKCAIKLFFSEHKQSWPNLLANCASKITIVKASSKAWHWHFTVFLSGGCPAWHEIKARPRARCDKVCVCSVSWHGEVCSEVWSTCAGRVPAAPVSMMTETTRWPVCVGWPSRGQGEAGLAPPHLVHASQTSAPFLSLSLSSLFSSFPSLSSLPLLSLSSSSLSPLSSPFPCLFPHSSPSLCLSLLFLSFFSLSSPLSVSVLSLSSLLFL